MERYILVARVGYCSLDCEQLSFAGKSVSERSLAARSRELRGRKFATRATLLLKYCRFKIFEQKRDCSKSNRSWKRDIKERYWGQELCQMERDISVRLSEMTRPVKVDHHQSRSRIFRSDQTEICPFRCSNRNFRNFVLNGKRPYQRSSTVTSYFLNIEEIEEGDQF